MGGQPCPWEELWSWAGWTWGSCSVCSENGRKDLIWLEQGFKKKKRRHFKFVEKAEKCLEVRWGRCLLWEEEGPAMDAGVDFVCLGLGCVCNADGCKRSWLCGLLRLYPALFIQLCLGCFLAPFYTELRAHGCFFKGWWTSRWVSALLWK